MSYDSELLRRYAEERSETAFAELVDRNLALVYAAALRQIGDADRAKDVAQRVFTDLARKAPALRRHPALLSWLFASTRYAAQNSIRTEIRRQKREREAHLMQELISPAGDADWQQLRPVLDQALCALRERERETILLRYFHGRSFAQIGDALAMNESAARQCANRALEKLRRALARRGVESTSTALALALANNVTATTPTGLSSAITAAALTASTAGTVGLLPALIGFMIGNKILLGTSAIVLLAGLVYSVSRTHSSAPLIDPAPVSNSRPSERAETSSAPVERATVLASSGATAVGTRAPSGESASPVVYASAPSGTRSLTEEQKARQATRREERQAARRAERRIDNLRQTAERRLAPLFATLDLTPEKRERLIQLVMNEHEAGVDYAAANARTGRDITSSPEEYFDAGWLTRQQVLADVKALLGDEGYAAFVANDLAVRQAAVVEHMQRRLGPGNERLTDQQSAQLIALFKQQHTFVVHDDIVTAAQGFLSPAQLDELKTEQQRQQAGVAKPPVQRAIKENLKSAPEP